MINIIVADDDKYICQSIKNSILKFFPTYLIHSVYDGLQVLKKVETIKVSVIILDIEMPHKNGLDTAIEVLKKFPEIKIIVTSSYKNINQLMTLKIIGVFGFIRKGCKANECKEALESVLNNQLYFAPEILAVFIEKGLIKKDFNIHKTIHDYRITETEFIVLRHIIENRTNQETAKIMSIEEKSVEKHLTSIYGKLLDSDFKNNCRKRDILKQLVVITNWQKSLNSTNF